MICTAVWLFLELQEVLRNSCEIPGSRLVGHVSSAAPFHSTIGSDAGRYLAADISPVNFITSSVQWVTIQPSKSCVSSQTEECCFISFISNIGERIESLRAIPSPSPMTAVAIPGAQTCPGWFGSQSLRPEEWQEASKMYLAYSIYKGPLGPLKDLNGWWLNLGRSTRESCMTIDGFVPKILLSSCSRWPNKCHIWPWAADGHTGMNMMNSVPKSPAYPIPPSIAVALPSNGWWMSHLSWFFQGEVTKAPSEFTTATNARYISIMFYPWFHMIPMNKRFFLIGKGIYSIIFPNALICFGVVLESQGEAFREAIYHQLPAWRCSSIVMTSSRPPQLKP